MKHLLVDISAHGYGHVAQTAPVVNALVQRFPDLRITLRCAAPISLLKQRFTCEFNHVSVALDFGMAMFDAVQVDVPRSLAAYREYHADWKTKVARAAQEMGELQPDLLLANVPYLSLAAAQAAQISAVAMCCLNWADLYRHYAPHDAESHAIHVQILEAYRSAHTFLKVQPTMPMPGLDNACEIAPIAKLGCKRREQICLLSGWNDCERLVLIAMGGIAHRLPMERWPRIPGVRWLIPQAWQIQRGDVIAFESLDMSFSDVLASSDAVLTKPGYGTFAEAACNGVPVLYVSRGEWPEQAYLVEWLQQHGVCREVTGEQFIGGDLAEALRLLWNMPKPPVPGASGAQEAAAIIEKLL
ncbi:MAG: hypothetical protein PHQ60_08070 [Sideroxydans sp.]|nr:hypothetical protein [Sideroxydans sp.]